MVKIRLMRVGKRKQPSYRVVVADSRSPRDGRIIEAIGRYNPRNEPSVVEINSDRAVHWLQHGAQPSAAVRKLLQITGAWYSFTGERPPAGAPAAPAAAPKPTPAESITATPAASVEGESSDETASETPPETEAESESPPEAEAATEGADEAAAQEEEE
jgi:small subunit ribosomal protein S16